MPQRLARALSFLKLLLFSLAMLLSLFLPIYTDELVGKTNLARYYLDGFKLAYLFPGCPSSFELKMPLAWIPIRSLDALLYGDLSYPIKLRIFGILSFLLWLLFCSLGLARMPQVPQVQRNGTGKFLGNFKRLVMPLSLGVIPFLMVINRVEQTLLWGIAFAIFFPYISPPDTERARWKEAARVAVFIWMIYAFFSYHPKAIFFAPLWVFSAIFSFRSWAVRICAWACALTAASALMTVTRAQANCPEIFSINYRLLYSYARPGELLTRPLKFAHDVLRNFAQTPVYAENMLFKPHYRWNWLPLAKGMGTRGMSAGIIALDAAFYCVFLTLIFCVAVSLYGWIKPGYRKIFRVENPFWAVSCISLSLLALDGLQKLKNFYEAGFFFSLLVLCLGCVWVAAPPALSKILDRAQPALDLLACVSLVVLLGRFTPYAFSDWSAGGYLPEQNMSFSAFNWDELGDRVRSVAEHCGLKAGDPLPYLVVDNITYSVFSSAYHPLFAFYLTDWTDDKDILRTMARAHSSGLITHCASIPNEAFKKATSDGEFCCLPKSE